MAGQFARMLADARLVDAAAAASGSGGAPGWEDPNAPWNRYAARPAVVPYSLLLSNAS